MKYFILILISLITLIIFASYGLIQTSSADKEKVRIVEEYGGIYVFDKEIRDEIIALQKQELIERKKVSFDDPNFVKKMVALEEKYSILSNGCKYYTGLFTAYDYKKIEPYIQKIKEYIGEEAYNKLQPNILLTSFYRINKNGVEKDIPIEISVSISWDKTTYGLYGDEGAGFRFTEIRRVGLGNFFNTFYLIDNKFIRYKEDRTKQNYKSSTKDK